MDILISNLLSELFLTLGNGQTENTQIRVFAYFAYLTDFFRRNQILAPVLSGWNGANISKMLQEAITTKAPQVKVWAG